MANNTHAWWYNVSPLNDFLCVLIGGDVLQAQKSIHKTCTFAINEIKTGYSSFWVFPAFLIFKDGTLSMGL